MLSMRTLTARRLARKTLAPLRSGLECLESRDVPATSLLAVGADAGGGPRVTLFDRATGAVVQDFFAYDPAFTGGVRVAVGDFNADGNPDVVTAPGAGGGPHIKVFDGETGAVLREFFAFDPGFLGGVNLAVGDVSGDGTPDVVAAADAGGPRVTVFDGKTGATLWDYFAFDPSFAGGVRVAVGNVTGSRNADVIAAAGPGGGPAVHAFDGATGGLASAFFAFDPVFSGGVNVAAADVNLDGTADVIAGAGAGGGPHVKVFDGAAPVLLNEFFAYDPAFTGGVRVAAFASAPFLAPDVLTAPGSGGTADVRVFNALTGAPLADAIPVLDGFLGGVFVGGSNFAATAGAELATEPLPPIPPSTGPTLVTLQLDPLNINLLGLQVTTSPITVTVSVEPGSGKLLGNLLTVVSNLVNLQGVNTALNNVLDSVVGLVNSATLVVDTAVGGGPLNNAPAQTTPVLDLFVAPVHLDLLGARVDTSPITVSIRANSGDGLVLGNVLTQLAHLFDPPLPERLELSFINSRLEVLLTQLEAALPGLPSAPVTPVDITSNSQVLRLAVPPIDLNLLGLRLQTEEIRVNADAQVGSGELLGNVLTTLLNTLNATPEERERLSNNVNALLAKVIGILNSTHLVLPAGAIDSLSQVLQTLALPDLVTATPGATAPVLDLSIASPDGSSPPVDVDLLGLKITTSNVRARLSAVTGEGQVLGNMVYNVAHLLDPGGTLNLLTILAQLGL